MSRLDELTGTGHVWRLRSIHTGQLLLLIAIALAVVYPLLLVLFTALKTPSELVSNPFGIPETWAFTNLVDAWNKGDLGQAVKSSVIVSVGVVVGTVFLSLLGGVAYARLTFPFKRLSFVLLTLGLVVPHAVLIMPLFSVMRTLNLLDSYLSLILPQIALGLPFGILLLRGFISVLPKEIMDAAVVDGANLWQEFRFVTLPLVSPAAVALAIFQFIWSWNQYLLPLVMIQDPSKRTLPLSLANYISRFSSDFIGLAAASIIAFLPVFIAYIIFRRRIMDSTLAGALKG